MSSSPPPPNLERLNRELESRGAQCEVCTVGGAMLTLVFSADPPTRNVKALFQPARLLEEAARQVAADLGLSTGWLADTVRTRLASAGPSGAVELSNLRVYSARPEYLLAMKCAALGLNQGPKDRDDIRFLLRFLDLSDADSALAVVHRYFNERQLPADLGSLLKGLLSA